MLIIEIEGTDGFNETTETSTVLPNISVMLEHSLVSVSKWESKYKRPFIGSNAHTSEETQDYIHMMCVEQPSDPYWFSRITQEDVDRISEYISDEMTATKIYEENKSSGGFRERVITSEQIYSWMFQLRIPIECDSWHINRLITLIRVMKLANEPQKKMSFSEMAARNRALNEQRRKQSGSEG